MRALYAPSREVLLPVGTSCKNKKKRNPINKRSNAGWNTVSTSNITA
jgi:hypothetical protein